MLRSLCFRILLMVLMLSVFTSIVFGGTSSSKPSVTFKTNSGSTVKVTQSPQSNSIMKNYQAQSAKQEAAKILPVKAPPVNTSVGYPAYPVPKTNNPPSVTSVPPVNNRTRVIKETHVIRESPSTSFAEMAFWSSMFNRPQEKVVVVQQPGVVQIPQQTAVVQDQSYPVNTVSNTTLPIQSDKKKSLSWIEKCLLTFGSIMIVGAATTVGYMKLRRRYYA